MSKRKILDKTDFLKSAAPFFVPIAEANEHENDFNKEFSCLNDLGDIMLIQHPNCWSLRFPENSHPVRIRPAPRLLMTYAQACKAITNNDGTGSSQKSENQFKQTKTTYKDNF
jgi:hypothetical protein